MSSMLECKKCGAYVNWGPVLCEECATSIEKEFNLLDAHNLLLRAEINAAKEELVKCQKESEEWSSAMDVYWKLANERLEALTKCQQEQKMITIEPNDKPRFRRWVKENFPTIFSLYEKNKQNKSQELYDWLMQCTAYTLIIKWQEIQAHLGRLDNIDYTKAFEEIRDKQILTKSQENEP